MRKFDLGELNIGIVNNYAAFEAFQQLVNDQDTLMHHTANLQMMSIDIIAETMEQIDGLGTHPLLRQVRLKDIVSANEVYMRQMIILAVTYLEKIIVEFIECLFVTHPSRMYNYLVPPQEKSLRGKVDLKEIIDADSKETLVVNLAIRAASIVTQGKFRTTISNVEKLSKIKLETSLVHKIETLVEQRNRIVHEASLEEITAERVSCAFDIVTSLLYALGKAAIENQVPCIDPVGWLEQKAG